MTVVNRQRNIVDLVGRIRETGKNYGAGRRSLFDRVEIRSRIVSEVRRDSCRFRR